MWPERLDLDRHGDALATADAEGSDAAMLALVAEGMDERAEDAGAAGPERMAERDGPAADIHPGRVELERADYGHRLGGECLIQLEQVYIGHPPAGPSEGPLHRRNWSQPHHHRIHAGRRIRNDSRQRLRAK